VGCGVGDWQLAVYQFIDIIGSYSMSRGSRGSRRRSSSSRGSRGRKR
jgi:hypothetical protein